MARKKQMPHDEKGRYRYATSGISFGEGMKRLMIETWPPEATEATEAKAPRLKIGRILLCRIHRTRETSRETQILS
jgi:hypothetical protein